MKKHHRSASHEKSRLMMKSCMLLAMCSLVMSFSVSAFAQSKEEIARLEECCPEIVYATNPEYPPYDWESKNGAYEGASIELLSFILPPGVKAKPVLYPWKRSLVLAEHGEIDLLVSLRITPEREKFLVFSTHRAFPNPIAVFVRNDRSFALTSWEVLKGRRGGVSLGDTFGGGFDEYWRENLQVEQALTVHENMHKLDKGYIDYFVTGYYTGLAALGTKHFSNDIIALDPPISNFDIHIGFNRASSSVCLREYMSRRLEELDREGVCESLLRKHLGIYLEQKRFER